MVDKELLCSEQCSYIDIIKQQIKFYEEQLEMLRNNKKHPNENIVSYNSDTYVVFEQQTEEEIKNNLIKLRNALKILEYKIKNSNKGIEKVK